MPSSGSLISSVSRTKNKVKLAPYECGDHKIGPTRRIMTIRYYIVAMLFLVFDIEIIFLYPWAVITKKLKTLRFHGDGGICRHPLYRLCLCLEKRGLGMGIEDIVDQLKPVDYSSTGRERIHSFL